MYGYILHHFKVNPWSFEHHFKINDFFNFIKVIRSTIFTKFQYNVSQWEFRWDGHGHFSNFNRNNEYVDSQGNFAYEMLYDIDEAMSQIGELNHEQIDSAVSTEVAVTDRHYDRVGETIGDQIDETNGEEFDEDELYGGEIDGSEIDGDGNNGDHSGIPPEILAQYEKAMRRILPKRSVQRYELMYKIFMEWQEKKNMRSFDERVLVAYFSSIAEQYAPSTLWSRYSMLKKH